MSPWVFNSKTQFMLRKEIAKYAKMKYEDVLKSVDTIYEGTITLKDGRVYQIKLIDPSEV